MSPDSARTWRLLLVFLAALAAAGAAVQPEIDVDTWWHLRVGEYVAQTRSVPATDPFSQVGQSESRPWVAYSWLYELGLYGAYRVGGVVGLSYARFLFPAVTLATLAWYFHRRAANQWPACIAFALPLPPFYTLLTDPHCHATIIPTALTLHAIQPIRTGARATILVAPTGHVVWANVHIQFVLGLGLFGLAAGVGVLERRPVGQLIGLAVACALATLVNPYHVRLYAVVWEYATQTGALAMITELRPPDPADWWTWPVMAITAWAIVIVVRRRFRLWDVALLAVGVAFAVRMQRDGWFACRQVARWSPYIDRSEIAAAPGWTRSARDRSLALVPCLGFRPDRTPDGRRRSTQEYPGTRSAIRGPPAGPLLTLLPGGYLILERATTPPGSTATNLHGEGCTSTSHSG